MTERRLLDEFVLEPATGRGIALKRGQVLRIEQIGNGQCLDFNAYNLHDYKEQFHSGRTRGLHGVNPTIGHHLWSAPPRERPMLTIIADTVGTNDVNYSRCSAFLFELHYGFEGQTAHSNCHDIFAEAIREWGLTPDDVHDSFNGFMHTSIRDGRLHIDWTAARAGDHIEMLAQIDALAVPICCGADFGQTNNYELKGLKIAVYDGTAEDQQKLVEHRFVHQRTPAAFRNATIKADRPLRRDPDFRPEWPWRDAVAARHPISVVLEPADQALLAQLRGMPRFHGFTDAEIVRYGFFQWFESKHRQPFK